MRLRNTGWLGAALFAGLLAGAPAWAADASGSDTGAGGGAGRRGPPPAATDACKGAKEGAQCKFQGRTGREITGTCGTRENALACVPAGHGMGHAHGGQGTQPPMQ